MTNHEERIAAWLDGAMSDAEAARFEAEMESNPDLAALAAAWRGNDELVREAFGAPVQEGVTDELLQRMGLTAPPTAHPVIDLAAHRATVRPSNDNGARRLRWALPIGGALAAALVLGMVVTRMPGEVRPGADRDAQFAAALEATPSRTTRTLPDGGRITPVLSFVAADGRYCREFVVTGGTTPGGGIACKGARWTIEARTRAGTRIDDPNAIATAGGGGATDLEPAYARLGASDPLSVEAEQALIRGKWQPSKTRGNKP